MVYQGVTMFKRKLSVILAATLATTAFAAKYEAESATLSGGATPGADNSASGSKFVNMNGGTITFPNVSVENAGKYELAITYRADNPKNNLIKVNGSTSQTLALYYALHTRTLQHLPQAGDPKPHRRARQALRIPGGELRKKDHQWHHDGRLGQPYLGRRLP